MSGGRSRQQADRPRLISPPWFRNWNGTRRFRRSSPKTRQSSRQPSGPPPGSLNERLERFAETTGVDAIYVMDDRGWTIASSNWKEPKTFLGQNYGFRPYFRTALDGSPGEYYAIGATTGVPGYFVSHPVIADGKGVVGVIAVKVELRDLEANWATPEGRLFITNNDGRDRAFRTGFLAIPDHCPTRR